MGWLFRRVALSATASLGNPTVPSSMRRASNPNRAPPPPSSAPTGPRIHEAELLLLVADWLWETDDQFRITRIEELNPLRPAPLVSAVLGRTPWDCGAFNLDESAWARHRRDLESRRPFRDLELHRRARNGRLYWSRISGHPLFDRDGRFLGYRGVAIDITDRKRAEQALLEARVELDATLQAIPNLMFELDRAGLYHRVHAPRPELLALPPEDLLGRNFHDVLPAEVATLIDDAMAEAASRGHSHGLRYRLDVPGGTRWFELSMAMKPHPTPDDLHFIALVRDITDLKTTEAQLQDLAFYDALTGLPNRRLLLDRVEQMTAMMLRTQEHGALLFIDLDGFKQVNDQYGHPAGDEVLQRLGARLKSIVRSSDPLGRLSGDEFLVMLPLLGESPDGARQATDRVGRQVVQALREPFTLSSGLEIPLSGSVGAVLFQGGHPVPELLAQADALMYRAKAAGKNRLLIEWWSPIVPPDPPRCRPPATEGTHERITPPA